MGFFLGCVVGCSVGYIVYALMQSAHDEDANMLSDLLNQPIQNNERRSE